MKKETDAHSFRRQLVAWRIAAVLSGTVFLTLCWILLDTLFAITASEGVSVEIPDLTGIHEDALVLPEWIEAESEYRYDDSPVGTVISQVPLAGSRRKLSESYPKCKMTLVISMGRACVRLRSVVGRDVRLATEELRGEGLSVRTVMRTGDVPEGTVLAMEPRAGTELDRGGTVILTVSAGAPRKTVSMPDVRGLSRAEALTAVGLSQLKIKDVVEVESDEPSGTVVRQSHQPGTVVMADTAITLYVSREKGQGESDVSGEGTSD